MHCLSGTTGRPTVVAYTRHDLVFWAEVLARTLVAGGLSDTSVFQVAVNSDRDGRKKRRPGRRNARRRACRRHRIQERLKAATGLSLRVRLVPPKTIERSEGKAKRVIDRRAM